MTDLILSYKEKLQKYSKYKPLLLFLVKAVCIYLVLKYLYLGYVGLADPKGTYNLEDFFGDFNLVIIITKVHTFISSMFLEMIGYDTIRSGKYLLIKGASGVKIEYACLGVELWITLIALIMSFPIYVKMAFQIKLLGALAGVLGIFLLNNIRIISIVLTNHFNHSMTQSIHDIFNYTVYIFIFIFFISWISYFSNKEKNRNPAAV